MAITPRSTFPSSLAYDEDLAWWSATIELPAFSAIRIDVPGRRSTSSEVGVLVTAGPDGPTAAQADAYAYSLENQEFLERYASMPPKVKAERIEGMVYMPVAAVSAGFHGDHHAKVITWLGVYEAATPGVVASDNSTVALDPGSDPQPDASLRILPSHGGRTTLNAEKYIEGAPELIVEITASSVSYDLGPKLEAYQRTGVREYLVHGEFDWFVLRDGQYVRATADSEGIYRSEIFPGLWLAADALIAGRLSEVLAVLQRGIAAAEHADLVKSLARYQQADGK